MTSTNIFQGMDIDSKSSSKVLRPPGGGSSNIFGTDPMQSAPAQKVSTTNNNIFGGDADSGRTQKNPDTGSRLFGTDTPPAAAAAAAPPDVDVAPPAQDSSPAGKATNAGRRNHVTFDRPEPDQAGITPCRKRFFKHEGRDGEEEDEEERKRREEEEEKEKQQQQQQQQEYTRQIAKPPRGSYNPITGEDYSDEPKTTPPTRTKQPPGGYSQGLW